MELSNCITESNRTRHDKYNMHPTPDSMIRISVENQTNTLSIKIHVKPVNVKNCKPTFINLFGAKEEFKYIFNNLELSTNLSKKIISNFVRNHINIINYNSTNPTYIHFKIHKNCIIYK